MLKKILIGVVLLAFIGGGGFFIYQTWLREPTRPGVELDSETRIDRSSTSLTPLENDQWPGFRGPLGTGFSQKALFPERWSSTSNLAWKTPLPGPGSSSPIVWGDKVFVTCYSGYGDESRGSVNDLKRHLVCLEKATGKILWDKTVPSAAPEDSFKGFIMEHGYASQTPVTDGQTVFAFFGKTGVVAFDFDGKQLWQTSVGTMSNNRRWGSSSSPVLYKDLVIVNASEESRAIKALDKKTGSEVWEAKGSSLELCFGTPVLVHPKGGRTDLVFALPGEIWGLNPETGKLVWFAKSPLSGNISPSVAVSDDIVIAFGGYPNTGAFAVRTGGRGDVTDSHSVWKSSKASYVPSATVLNNHLYWLNDQGQACCADAGTGKMIFQERLPVGRGEGKSKPVYASALLAGDKVFGVTRREGTVVFKAEPQYSLIGINKIEGDETDFNASPAISGNQLFLRSNKAIYCFRQTDQSKLNPLSTDLEQRREQWERRKK